MTKRRLLIGLAALLVVVLLAAVGTRDGSSSVKRLDREFMLRLPLRVDDVDYGFVMRLLPDGTAHRENTAGYEPYPGAVPGSWRLQNGTLTIITAAEGSPPITRNYPVAFKKGQLYIENDVGDDGVWMVNIPD